MTLREKTSKLESRVAADVWDVEAWTSLILEANQSKDLEFIRDVYGRFLKIFPTAVRTSDDPSELDVDSVLRGDIGSYM